jgi:prepilin-type N-terminal cleavage/methylation domain-containing protein
MGDSLQKDSRQSGVTLPEMLVVIIIIAVLAGFALIKRSPADVQLKRQNVAQQLKATLERARFDSVKRRADSNAMASVTITPTNFTLRTYTSSANTNTPHDQTTTLPDGIVIALSSGTLSSTEVTFNMRGETPASPAPHFYVCNVDCSSPSDATANFLLVTPTGTVNLLRGSATVPTFGAPAVVPVPAATMVNPDTVLP